MPETQINNKDLDFIEKYSWINANYQQIISNELLRKYCENSSEWYVTNFNSKTITIYFVQHGGFLLVFEGRLKENQPWNNQQISELSQVLE